MIIIIIIIIIIRVMLIMIIITNTTNKYMIIIDSVYFLFVVGVGFVPTNHMFLQSFNPQTTRQGNSIIIV